MSKGCPTKNNYSIVLMIQIKNRLRVQYTSSVYLRAFSKLILLVSIIIISSFSVVAAKPANSNSPIPIPVTSTEAPEWHIKRLSNEESKKLTDRLNEIIQLDKNKLTRQQKRELRNELKDIKQKLEGGYIYISGTALLIILLLILLL